MEERREALAERAGRQLLVALHEATYGIPFEEIIVDEFRHIEPYEAQRLYLTVCVLNRLKVPVRAGIVARIHGIPFAEFKLRFFGPLEHVVFSESDAATRDYVYRARHPHIADIVFQRILANAEERFDVYIKCLKALNVSYSADWTAFWQMVRGRTLLDLFPNHEMVTAIFAAAKEGVGEDAHLLHQMALYEAHRANGSHQEASRLLARAAELAPYDVPIRHSAAELKLRFLEDSQTPLERAKTLKDAAALTRDLVMDDRANAHAQHTLVKIGIRTLQESIDNDGPDILIEKQVRDVEDQLFAASQLFPGDSYLLESEAALAKLLSDHERALKAISKAFDANPRNGHIALRLAQVFERRGQGDEAKKVLEKGLGANNADKRLHFALGKLLMRSSATDEELLYHFRRSFSDGDSNYDAQLLYARQLFVKGDLEASRKAFEKLAKAPLPNQFRTRLLYPLDNQRFSGRIWRIESSYALVIRDGPGDLIFLHISNAPRGLWRNLSGGDLLRFSLAFTFRGPNAFDVDAGAKNLPHGQMDLPLEENEEEADSSDPV
jgi:tetratricopeptide (TPR) repeat protein